MRKLILIATALFVMQGCLSVETGNQKIDNQNAGDFTSLSVSNGVPVTLVADSKTHIDISGKDANYVTVENENGTLNISLSMPFRINNGSDVHVTLYYVNLNDIEVNSAASVKATAAIHAPSITLNAHSAGNMTLEILTQKLVAKASSAGSIHLSGTADYQKAEVSSAAVFSAKNLKSKQADVSAGSAASATVYATDLVNAEASSAASINIYGNPKNVNKDVGSMTGASINVIDQK